MQAAVDIGYGYVKAVDAVGHRVVFPSVWAPNHTDAEWNATMGTKRVPDQVIWSRPGENSKAFWIGETARRRPGATRPWAEAAAEREGYLLLVAAALAQLVPESQEIGPVDLVVGLPLGLYSLQKAALIAMLEQHRGTVAWAGQAPQAYWVRQVHVFPQAAGAFYAEALRGPADWRRPGAQVAVVDVGYRTTDYFVMDIAANGVARGFRDQSGSLEVGLSQVTESVRQAVEADLRQLVDPLRVEAAIAGAPPELSVFGHTIDLSEWRATAATSLGMQIADLLRGTWGAATRDFSQILIAGGGAQLLGPVFESVWPQARTVRDPVMANAEGFLLAVQQYLATVSS